MRVVARTSQNRIVPAARTEAADPEPTVTAIGYARIAASDSAGDVSSMRSREPVPLTGFRNTFDCSAGQAPVRNDPPWFRYRQPVAHITTPLLDRNETILFPDRQLVILRALNSRDG
jgi:hypothetical protein